MSETTIRQARDRLADEVVELRVEVERWRHMEAEEFGAGAADGPCVCSWR